MAKGGLSEIGSEIGSESGTEIKRVLAGELDGCIVQGDCLEVMREMPDGCADMVFMDPPYGHNNNNGDLIANREAALGRGKSGPARPIANDGPEANQLVQNALGLVRRLLPPGACCCCCCCGGGGPDPQFARWSLWMDEAIGFKQMVIWDKGGLGMGWHYRRNYETVLVGQKPGAKCRWYGGHRTPNVVRIPKIIPRRDQHPTQKPVELAEWFLSLHSRPGDLVLDPFCGAGTTCVAAKGMGRRYIGIELDGHWCADARRRLKNTPRPLLAGGGK